MFLSATLPKLYSHLQQVGFPLDTITTKWFMCLFAETGMPTETLLRIWDSFFLYGADEVPLPLSFSHQPSITNHTFLSLSSQLICIALTLFRRYEKELLLCREPEDVRQILREGPCGLVDADRFMKVSGGVIKGEGVKSTHTHTGVEEGGREREKKLTHSPDRVAVTRGAPSSWRPFGSCG